MELRTPGGVVVDQFPFATTLGADDTTALLRDFGSNGRFQVYGNGSVVQLETGPLSGDDIGGTGRLGGWDGTQGDALSIDYAATTVTGTLAVTGLTPFPKRLLGPTTETASSLLNIALDANYECWELHIRNLTNSAQSSLRGTLSFDGAGSFKTGAADYITAGLYIASGGITNIVPATAASLQLYSYSAGTLSATGEAAEAVIRITSKAGRETRFRTEFAAFEFGSPGTSVGFFAGSTNAKDFGKATHIQLSPSTGTQTFEYVLYGVR